ncbi:hypothetical protein HCN44_010207 [Aphidius gifuensis]|uniref:NADH dehydrogenase [ubiquinone] 1 beta subcomplex subunit 2, mitochondrial n=1 Tax=Aphidius gifuensis TaxID=684658 RepID=A0A834XVZ3_APHGI|nr:NADH dehydrogenase [ubiquinone] 1 beta subcomplex subunit 2, mitochondrial-like [Aphidius gifuensis]KAF7993612.1 hypothetical protein HCN44_010207 [Aphidius gifuensis]
MLISRGFGLAKNVAVIATRKLPKTVVQTRNSGHSYMYRDVKEAPRKDVWMAEISTGIMWWWVLWHMWHDWGHIVGEFDYPDPSKWTNEELGIPPDDVDL